MSVQTMDAATLKQALDAKQVVIIDVREPEEYAKAHIVGTTLIPLATVSYDKIPMEAGKKLVIHCHSGKRSQFACEQLIEAQPSLEVYNLEGGILAWMNLGYPVATGNT